MEQIGVSAYFISWAFLAGFIMMNIVLAILVDSFTEAQTELKREQARSSQNGPFSVHSENHGSTGMFVFLIQPVLQLITDLSTLFPAPYSILTVTAT